MRPVALTYFLSIDTISQSWIESPHQDVVDNLLRGLCTLSMEEHFKIELLRDYPRDLSRKGKLGKLIAIIGETTHHSDNVPSIQHYDLLHPHTCEGRPKLCAKRCQAIDMALKLALRGSYKDTDMSSLSRFTPE